MASNLKIYSQIYPYLSKEAKELVKTLTDKGMDRDLAMQLVEMVLSEEDYYEF